MKAQNVTYHQIKPGDEIHLEEGRHKWFQVTRIEEYTGEDNDEEMPFVKTIYCQKEGGKEFPMNFTEDGLILWRSGRTTSDGKDAVI